MLFFLKIESIPRKSKFAGEILRKSLSWMLRAFDSFNVLLKGSR